MYTESVNGCNVAASSELFCILKKINNWPRPAFGTADAGSETWISRGPVKTESYGGVEVKSRSTRNEKRDWKSRLRPKSIRSFLCQAFPSTSWLHVFNAPMIRLFSRAKKTQREHDLFIFFNLSSTNESKTRQGQYRKHLEIGLESYNIQPCIYPVALFLMEKNDWYYKNKSVLVKQRPVCVGHGSLLDIKVSTVSYFLYFSLDKSE